MYIFSPSQVENDISELCARGVRCLAVARTDPLGEWVFLGLLTFLDPPRPDTLQTILDSKKYGVAVKMITGKFTQFWQHTHIYQVGILTAWLGAS